MEPLGTPLRARSAAVLLLAAGLLAGALRLATAPPVGAQPFTALLCRLAADALVVATAWGCLVAASLLLEALSRGRCRTLSRTGCPATLRRLLLGACGAALAAGVAAPSYADERGALDGLPLPDRTVGTLPAVAPKTRVHVVRPGDSLWRIAERLAGPGDTRRVAALVDDLLRLNRRSVPDPDLIHPGQRLRLPTRAPAAHPRSEADR